MKKVINKIIAKPAFYGGVYGAIAGSYIGLIVAYETGKPVKRLVNEGAGIGIVTGSVYASLLDTANTRQVFRFLKEYRKDGLVENLFA